MAVFAWGANSHGQLGLGYESEMSMEPQRLKKYSFTVTSVRSIRGGGGHVLVLDACGQLHACGWNNRGQLGLDITQDNISEFKMIPMKFFKDSPIDLMACGWDSSGCITSDRKLFLWGSNAFQQLGVCHRGFTSVRKPMQIQLPGNDTPLRLSLGMRHSAILTSEWKVYIYGRMKLSDNISEMLSIVKITQSLLVVKIASRWSEEYCIKNIASGQNHVLMHLGPIEDNYAEEEKNTASKRVEVFGDNKYGQANAFQFEEKIIRLAAGWTHNSVLLKNNSVLSWGRNSYGQLGWGQFTENHAIPMQLSVSPVIVPIDLHLGSEHGLMVTKEGDVFTWGWNEHGNCGNNSTNNIATPTLVDLPTACKIAACGAGFCFAICAKVN